MDKKDLIDNLISDWNKEQPNLDASAMQVVGRILKLGKIFEKRASKTLSSFKIHYTDFDVLATIKRSGPPYELAPSELMKSVLITSGAMTASLNRLNKLKLIYRCPNPKDGRIKLAGLTPKGIKLINKSIETRFNEASESIKILDEADKTLLSNLLKKLLISIDSKKNNFS